MTDQPDRYEMTGPVAYVVKAAPPQFRALAERLLGAEIGTFTCAICAEFIGHGLVTVRDSSRLRYEWLTPWLVSLDLEPVAICEDCAFEMPPVESTQERLDRIGRWVLAAEFHYGTLTDPCVGISLCKNADGKAEILGLTDVTWMLGELRSNIAQASQ